jgi:Tfp pilus assembly pilus retraction ATPase PilT
MVPVFGYSSWSLFGWRMRMDASAQREPWINMLFHGARLFEATDLYLDVGALPRFRIRGDIIHVHSPPLTQAALACAVSVILDSEQLDLLRQGNDLVVTYRCPEGVAYRVSVLNKEGRFSLWALRLRGSVEAELCSATTAPAEPEVPPDRQGITTLQSQRLPSLIGR